MRHGELHCSNGQRRLQRDILNVRCRICGQNFKKDVQHRLLTLLHFIGVLTAHELGQCCSRMSSYEGLLVVQTLDQSFAEHGVCILATIERQPKCLGACIALTRPLQCEISARTPNAGIGNGHSCSSLEIPGVTIQVTVRRISRSCCPCLRPLPSLPLVILYRSENAFNESRDDSPFSFRY